MASKRSKTHKRRYFRNTLLAENPHCFWCGRPVVLPERDSPAQDNWATIDHLRSRLHPDRHEPKQSPHERRSVLACWQCNGRRNNFEMDAVGIDVIRESSGSMPATREKLIDLVERQRDYIEKLRHILSLSAVPIPVGPKRPSDPI